MAQRDQFLSLRSIFELKLHMNKRTQAGNDTQHNFMKIDEAEDVATSDAMVF